MVATLYLDVTGSLTFNSSSVGLTDFNAGYRQSSTDLTMLHRGNVSHRVQISSSASTLSFTPLAGRSETNPNKPASDVRLSLDNFTSSVPLSSTGNTLKNQVTPTGTGSETVKGRILLGWADTPPGTYSTTITFTIVQN